MENGTGEGVVGNGMRKGVGGIGRMSGMVDLPQKGFVSKPLFSKK